MAKAKVVHSEDAVTILFEGNKNSPEPTTGVIKFPGGLIEVSRCSDGSYWVHTHVDNPQNIVDSRMDYQYPVSPNIVEIPEFGKLQKIAVRVAKP